MQLGDVQLNEQEYNFQPFLRRGWMWTSQLPPIPSTERVQGIAQVFFFTLVALFGHLFVWTLQGDIYCNAFVELHKNFQSR